jgi:hypothetical protein
LPSWAQAQIDEDFQLFNEGIPFSVIEKTCQRRKDFYDKVQIVIVKNNIVYSNGYIKKAIQRLAQSYILPDLIFYYFDYVGPLTQMVGCDGFAPPILAGSKTAEMKNIILTFHRYSFVRDGRYGLEPTLAEVKKGDIEWNKKIDKLFWRGVFTDNLLTKRFINLNELKLYFKEDFCSSRMKLVKLSRDYFDLLDANFFDRKDWNVSITQLLHSYGLNRLASFANIADHLKYKYQICIDGQSTTQPGFVWRLWSNSCVFKVYSPNYEWFYKGLTPWVHFIPVESDVTDLVEKITWAKNHDNEVQQIIENAHDFSRTFLNTQFHLLYTYKVLCKYAALQQFTEDDFQVAIKMYEDEKLLK